MYQCDSRFVSSVYSSSVCISACISAIQSSKGTDNERSTASEKQDQYSRSQVLLPLHGASGQLMKTELGNLIRSVSTVYWE